MNKHDSLQIIEEAPGRLWRTELPDIVWDLKLSHAAFKLYMWYRRVAADNGCCYQTQKEINEGCGVSVRSQCKINKELCRPRDELGGKSLIRLFSKRTEKGDKGPNQIFIVYI